MWRTKEWKLILYQVGKVTDATSRVDEVHGELYDLTSDPQEWCNLYEVDQFKTVRETLTRQLLMHLASVWARYPRQNARAKI
jgi:arylsulfatase A-like enzyme